MRNDSPFLGLSTVMSQYDIHYEVNKHWFLTYVNIKVNISQSRERVCTVTPSKRINKNRNTLTYEIVKFNVKMDATNLLSYMIYCILIFCLKHW